MDYVHIWHDFLAFLEVFLECVMRHIYYCTMNHKDTNHSTDFLSYIIHTYNTIQLLYYIQYNICVQYKGNADLLQLKYQFLEASVAISLYSSHWLSIQKSTKAIMDQFVVGKRRGHVFCEVIDADTNGIAPDEDGFDESTPSLLDVIVKANDKV